MILGTNLLDVMNGVMMPNEVIVEEKQIVTLEVAEHAKHTISLLKSTVDEMYLDCKVMNNFDMVLAKHGKAIAELNKAIQFKDIHIKPEKGYIRGYWNGEQIFYVSLGNAKLAPDMYGNGFMIWSIVGKITCNGKTELCGKNCYNTAKSFANNVKSKIKNAIFTQLDCFEDAMIKVGKMSPYAKNTYFRIHEDGDFFNGEYTKKWFNIAKKLEGEKIKFMAYTKEPKILPYINTINKECKNVTFRYSIMEDTDAEIKKYIIEHEVPVYICLGTVKVNMKKLTKKAMEVLKVFNHVTVNNRCVNDCSICKKCYYTGIKQVVTVMHA